MADRFTTTETQSGFSRIANSFFGVLIGLLMVPGSVLLIGWNEYRTVHRTKGLIEAEKNFVEVGQPDLVTDEHEAKLIHVTGNATTQSKVEDPLFPEWNGTYKESNPLRVHRSVEMFQWVEKKESKTRDKLGGGKETITTYEYNQKWHRGRVNSESFAEPTGHNNPAPKYEEKYWNADIVSMGKLRLVPELVDRIDLWNSLSPDPNSILKTFGESEKKNFAVEGATLFYRPNGTPTPQTPVVGDLKIELSSVDPTEVSVLAMLSKESLVSYKTSNGEQILSLQVGNKPAVEMFASLRFENSMMAYILRFAGWLIACIGFCMIAGPLHALANIIPIFGKMVGFATMLIGFMLGSIVALSTIGIAWIAVRPVYGLGLLAIAFIGIYFLVRRRKPSEPPIAVPI